jgi:hypothetical protein
VKESKKKKLTLPPKWPRLPTVKIFLGFIEGSLSSKQATLVSFYAADPWTLWIGQSTMGAKTKLERIRVLVICAFQESKMAKSSFFQSFLVACGLAPSEEDKKIIELIRNGPKSARVVVNDVTGRWRLTVDPREVCETKEWKEAQRKAADLVKRKRGLW